jgi:hypothetical protein
MGEVDEDYSRWGDHNVTESERVKSSSSKVLPEEERGG